MKQVSIERLEQIEREREEVASNPAYQAWMKELNVSRSYSDPSAKLNGAELTSQYNYSNFTYNLN